MIQSHKQSTRGISRRPGSTGLKQLLGPLLLALALSLCPARADEAEDRYLSIYTVIQRADELNDSGHADQALAKYREAHNALIAFQKEYPTWNVKLVAFRLNETSTKVAALKEKLSAPAGSTNAASRATPDTKAAASAVQVRLLEPGAEPRTALRLHPKPDDKQTVSMNLKIAMGMGTGDAPAQTMKLPAITLAMDTTVKSVSPEGDIGYETVMGDTTVAEEAGGMPGMADMMKTSLAGLKGLSGTGILSSRGISKAADFKLPSGTAPQVSQAFPQVKDSFSMLGVPLPEEPVGTGAKWEVKRTIKSQGITLDQTETYQLVSLEGQRLTLKSTIAQRAANQKIQSPAMPTMKVDLTKLTGTGTGETTADLGQLMPIAGTVDVHTDTSMATTMNGQQQNMSVKTDMNLKMEAK